MKDLFISYGRRESLVFVGKLHRLVKLAGYDAWFDKVNIPDGDDYAQRISHGIESAHNFAYVMAPRCMTSPYCLIELEYARLLGKRVIPLAQIVIFETAAKELSAADQQVMVNFYQTHGIKGISIITEADVLKRSHELIGRTDWVYAREEYTPEDITAMTAWQASYENTWFKHDNLDYLQTYQFPIWGKCIDNLDGVVAAVLRLVDKHKPYVHTHTELLKQALEWHKGNKLTEQLLVGIERKEAEQWIRTTFEQPEQPPTVISAFHAEFICESRKNAENLFTDVFISYDAENKTLRDAVYKSLSQHLVTTWLHHRDIGKGKNFEEAIRIGIEQSKYMLFFISNDSLQSEWCMKELEYATTLNKKVIPLLIEKLTNPRLFQDNHYINKLQYIDFTNNQNPVDYDRDLADILREIHTDDSYYEQHRTFLCQALKWQRQNNNDSILLQGNLLVIARNWLKAGSTKPHPPLALHQEFIEASIAKIGKLNSEVFISYSRNDGDFARKINIDLQTLGSTTWFDQESIPVGATNFEEEIRNGIAQSDNFLFLISTKSINSPYCKGEVAYAVSLNKRIITVLVETLDEESKQIFKSLPKLSQVQWIDLRPHHNYEKGFEQLYRGIKSDGEYVKSHTHWGRKAADWDRANRRNDLLLRGAEVIGAEKWLEDALQHQKYPEPTPLQTEFVRLSKQALLSWRKKEVNTVRKLRGLFVFSMVALVASLAAYITADMQKQLSETNYLLNIAQQNVSLDPIKAIRAAEVVRDRGIAIENSHFYESADKVANDALRNLRDNKAFYFSLNHSNGKEWIFTHQQKEIIEYSLDNEYVGAGVIRRLDAQTYALKKEFSVKKAIVDVQVSPNDQYLLVRTKSGWGDYVAAQLWTINGDLLHDFEVDRNAYFSKDSRKVILTGSSITIYDIATKKNWELPTTERILDNEYALIDNSTFFLTRNIMDTVSMLSLWNVNTQKIEWTQRFMGNTVLLAPNAKYIATTVEDSLICLNTHGKRIWTRKYHNGVSGVRFSEDSRFITAIVADNLLHLTKTEQPQDSLTVDVIDGVALKTQILGDTAIFIQTDKDVRIIHLAEKTILHQFRHETSLKYAILQPLQATIITFDANYNLRRWRLDSQEAQNQLMNIQPNTSMEAWVKEKNLPIPILNYECFGIKKTTINDVLLFYLGFGYEILLLSLYGLVLFIFFAISIYYLFKRRWKKMLGYGLLVPYGFVAFFVALFSFMWGIIFTIIALYWLYKLTEEHHTKVIKVVRNAFLPVLDGDEALQLK